MSDTLYIKMDQCVEVTESYVTIGDLGKLECKNKTVVNRLKPIKLLNDNSNGKKRYIVSIMKIFEIVDKEFENVDVQSIGETDCIIEFKKANSDNKAFEILKVIGICIILFFPLCLLTTILPSEQCLKKYASWLPAAKIQVRLLWKYLIPLA